MSSLDALLAMLWGHHDALALGTGHSVVTRELSSRGIQVDRVCGDWPSIQLPRRYRLAIVGSPDDAGALAEIVHCGAQHLEPGGLMVICGDARDSGDRFDLRLLSTGAVEGIAVALYRRTDRPTIHDRVFDARSRIRRVAPADLARRLLHVRRPTVVDTRTATDRSRFGVIAGSIHVPRTVVEWHLDPANGYRHAEVTSFDQPLVLVCNGGYSSSLAAASLLDLGFTDVGDLIGGVRAWSVAGYEVVAPDHSHLDL